MNRWGHFWFFIIVTFALLIGVNAVTRHGEGRLSATFDRWDEQARELRDQVMLRLDLVARSLSSAAAGRPATAEETWPRQ
jgi:hypothetical protein